MITIARPQIGIEEKNAVNEVLESGTIAEGPKVLEFERMFAKFIGAKYAIAVNSGTAALCTTLLAHGIGKDGRKDEVITTPFTFIATANSILFAGARPIFVDIEDDTFNIDPDKIAEKITSSTKAILPVHLYGHPADMKIINEIADDYSLTIIEDACQAHAAKYDGKYVGSQYGTGTFSFYPTKNMTTGEGGMITTNDSEIYEYCMSLRSHGSGKQRYVHKMLGYNFRMTDISAAIGIEQLKKLDIFTKSRQQNATYMSSKLSDIPGIITPVIRNNCEHVFHQYTIRVTKSYKLDRDSLSNALNEKGIGTGIYYPMPIYKQQCYRELDYMKYGKLYLQNAEKMSKEVLSIPIHPGVSKSDIDFISETIKNVHIRK